MRKPINAVVSHQRSDGADGSQVLVFQCATNGISKKHVHDFDEYFVVIQGEYTLGIEGKTIKLTSGQEYFIPKGIPHAGSFLAGTRTINAFGDKRAERK